VATALLFDRDQVDELDEWRGLPRIRSSSLLWIDLESPDEPEIAALAEELEVSPKVAEALAHPGDEPQLTDLGAYLHVTGYAPASTGSRELCRIDCLVSERWIVTVHDTPLDVLETFRERVSGSGATGDLDGPEFLANIIEWVLHAYLDAFEEIERSLEEIDALAMQGEVPAHDGMLTRLVESRREIGRLRRALTSHREVVLALTHPELEAITSSHSAERFVALRDRLEEAAQSARDSRDAVVGSFDLVIASTGQRTNEIVKVLTVASVLLLPGALVAGILGMNFRLGIFDDPSNFWLALALIVGMASVTLVVARMRHWI
jgi:Mg2+ and Co2+ transporter CorA